MTTLPILQSRSCGDCDECCIYFDVVAPPLVDTRKGERCKHSSPAKGGCQVYAERPPVCRNFECLWLQGRVGKDESDRPDKLRVMYRTMPHAVLGEFVEVYELTAGALNAHALDLAARAGSFVTCKNADGTPGPVFP